MTANDDNADMECELIEADIRDKKKLCCPWSMLLLHTEEMLLYLAFPKNCAVWGYEKDCCAVNNTFVHIGIIYNLLLITFSHHIQSSHWSQTLPNMELHTKGVMLIGTTMHQRAHNAACKHHLKTCST